MVVVVVDVAVVVMVVTTVSAAMAVTVSLLGPVAGCCLEKVGPTGATNDSNEPFAALLDFLVCK